MTESNKHRSSSGNQHGVTEKAVRRVKQIDNYRRSSKWTVGGIVVWKENTEVNSVELRFDDVCRWNDGKSICIEDHEDM